MEEKTNMFSQIFNKLGDLGHHHQALFAALVALCVICISWGVEQVLETYVFPKHHIYSYLTAIGGGVIVLWLIQHFILHVI